MCEAMSRFELIEKRVDFKVNQLVKEDCVKHLKYCLGPQKRKPTHLEFLWYRNIIIFKVTEVGVHISTYCIFTSHRLIASNSFMIILYRGS